MGDRCCYIRGMFNNKKIHEIPERNCTVELSEDMEPSGGPEIFPCVNHKNNKNVVFALRVRTEQSLNMNSRQNRAFSSFLCYFSFLANKH